MLTVIIKIMTVIRKKPDTTLRAKEGFTEEVIFKFGLELTIKKNPTALQTLWMSIRRTHSKLWHLPVMKPIQPLQW